MDSGDNFGDFVRKWREGAEGKLTQAEMARAINNALEVHDVRVTQSDISEIEKNRGRISLQFIVGFALATGYPIEFVRRKAIGTEELGNNGDKPSEVLAEIRRLESQLKTEEEKQEFRNRLKFDIESIAKYIQQRSRRNSSGR